MPILIKGGKVVDPGRFVGVGDVLPDMPLTEQPLANATAALQDLRAGRVRGRIILKTETEAVA